MLPIFHKWSQRDGVLSAMVPLVDLRLGFRDNR